MLPVQFQDWGRIGLFCSPFPVRVRGLEDKYVSLEWEGKSLTEPASWLKQYLKICYHYLTCAAFERQGTYQSAEHLRENLGSCI